MALVVAYILAGEIATRPDYTSAFEAYEKLARPFVEMNQALVEEGKHILIPNTQEDLDARNAMLREMADEPVREAVRKEGSRQVHSALSLPDYS